MPRALVTGGAGFIGSHTAEVFLGRGYDVTIVDDLSSGNRDNVPTGATLHVTDIASRTTRDLIASTDFDVIAHLAAQIDVRKSVEDPEADARTNVLGTLNMLEAIRGLSKRPRLVFASTGGALYGAVDILPTPETVPPNPDSPYGIAKLAVEHYLAYYGRIWGFETAAVRFGNVYGPRQDPHGEAGVVAIFCNRLVERRALTVYGTGEQTRDYVYVRDVADAIVAAANRPLPAAGALEARAFNIGTGVETSVLELARLLGTIAGVSLELDMQPHRAGELDRSCLAIDKAASVLGWRAPTTLERGLSDTFAWVSGGGGSAPRTD